MRPMQSDVQGRHHAVQSMSNWTKKCFNMYTKIHCCAVIHYQLWMIRLPNDSQVIRLTLHMSFIVSKGGFVLFQIKPGLHFLKLKPKTYIKFDNFIKLIHDL